MAYVCNWAQLNEEIQDINNTIGGRDSYNNNNRAVIFGLTASQTLSSGTLTSAEIAWDRVIPQQPGGSTGTPSWIRSYDGFIKFAQAGLYQLSWSIDWTANGSGQDHASSYLSYYLRHDAAYTDLDPIVFAAEDAGISDSLVFPATPFKIGRDDSIKIIIDRVSGASSSGWTARSTSFLSIIKL